MHYLLDILQHILYILKWFRHCKVVFIFTFCVDYYEAVCLSWFETVVR